MAVLATAAGLRLVFPHDQVPDFSRGSVGSMDDPAVENDAASASGAKGDHHQVLIPGSAAPPLLAQSGHVRVVARPDRKGQLLRELPLHIEDAPAQVDTLADGSVRQNRTGNAKAHALDVSDLQIFLGDFSADGGRNVFQDEPTAVLQTGGNLPAFQQGPRHLQKPDLDRGPSHVDAKAILFHDMSFPVRNPPGAGVFFSVWRISGSDSVRPVLRGFRNRTAERGPACSLQEFPSLRRIRLILLFP